MTNFPLLLHILVHMEQFSTITIIIIINKCPSIFQDKFLFNKAHLIFLICFTSGILLTNRANPPVLKNNSVPSHTSILQQ